MKKIMFAIFIFLVSLTLIGCEKDEQVLRLITPTAQTTLDVLVPKFEAATGIKLEAVVKATGAAVAELENTKENPIYDVVWFPEVEVLNNESLFIEYKSPHENLYDEALRTTSKVGTNVNFVVPILLYNKTKVSELGITVDGYQSLLQTELKGKIAYGSISSASTYNHIENMLLAMGTGATNDEKITSEAGWNYIRQFLQNLDGKDGVGSAAMLSGVQSGEYTVAMSYDTQGSIAKENKENAYDNVGVVFMKEGVLAKNSSVAVVKGGREDLAKKFVDWLSSKEGQEVLGLESPGGNPSMTSARSADHKVKVSELTVIPLNILWSSEKKAQVTTAYTPIYEEIFA